MKKRIVNVSFQLFSVFSLAFLVTVASGCPGKTIVEKCSVHDSNKAACNEAKQKTGEECTYDETKNECVVKTTTPTGCLAKSDDECKASKKCTFDAKMDPKCSDATQSLMDKCGAIQVEEPCKKDNDCLWQNDACKEKAGLSAKTVKVYTLTKLEKNIAKGGYGINDDKDIGGITASKDGTHVYLIGTKESTLKSRSLDATSNQWTWKDALGNVFKPRNAYQLVDELNWGPGRVSKWASLHNGIAIWVENQGVAQIVGTGADNSFGWKMDNDQLNKGNANGIGEVKKGDDYYLYMSLGDGLANSVAFIKEGSAQYNASDKGQLWNTSLQKAKNMAIDKKYSQFFGETRLMLMLQQGGRSVDWLLTDGIGKDAAKIDDSGEVNMVTASDGWVHTVGAANPAQKLAMMGNYLVVVFRGGDVKTGGVGYFDLGSGNKYDVQSNWTFLNKDIAATDIFLDDANNQAIITAKNGFLILDLDAQGAPTLVEPVDGEGTLINADHAAKAVTNYVGAKDGFAGADLPAAANVASYVGAAKGGDLWYIAIRGNDENSGGVYALKIEEQTITP